MKINNVRLNYWREAAIAGEEPAQTSLNILREDERPSWSHLRRTTLSFCCPALFFYTTFLLSFLFLVQKRKSTSEISLLSGSLKSDSYSSELPRRRAPARYVSAAGILCHPPYLARLA